MKEDDKIKTMAELLLSKATMLQYHCGECGSPLFEKEGKIICPVCGELEEKEKKKEKEKVKVKKEGEKAKVESQKLQDFLGKKVVVKTESTMYRGVCEKVDDETLSLTLRNAERVKPFSKPTEAEWSCLSDLLFIHGSMVEAVWLDKKD